MSLAHGDNVPFDSAIHDVPETLINDEWRLPMITSVLVCLGHDPRGGIRDTLESCNAVRPRVHRGRAETYQIEHFSLLNERVETIHHFFDRGLPVPPVDVEDIDIRRPELFQACFQADMHRFDAVPRVQHLLLELVVPAYIIRGILSSRSE